MEEILHKFYETGVRFLRISQCQPTVDETTKADSQTDITFSVRESLKKSLDC